jgi:hypothetical protein
MPNQPEQPNSEWLDLFEEALESAYEAGKDDANHDIDIEERAKAAIEAHVQAAVAEARIDEHRLLWSIVPTDAEHIGTIKDISNLRVVKLEATLRTSKPQEEKSE